MGNCCSSNAREFEESELSPKSKSSLCATYPSADHYADGPLSLDDIYARISASEATQVYHTGSCALHYAFVSQRGYYPEALSKPNQDTWLCQTAFGGDKSCALFSVFDGHGVYGDVAARFAKEKLPENLQECLASKSMDVTSSITRSHVITNSQESVSAGRSGEKHLIAKPLSIDQTPFRRDERHRVKKTGARVMTVDQLEGLEPMHEDWGISLGEEIDETGDPPRIWHPIGDYPGTAFTRSFGDAISEELGVIAEPEILSKTLNKHDKFIVIASDGVFEFLTSQAVVNMVKEYDDPLEACRAVVAEAYNLWLQYEVRTDDISMICIFLKDLQESRDSARRSIYAGAEMLDMQDMQKPVRGKGTRSHAKRDTIAGVDGIRLSTMLSCLDEDEEEHNKSIVKENSVPKTEEEEKQIREIVKSNFLFRNLTEQQMKDVVSNMKKEEVHDGDIIIKQNDPGETFYIISQGKYEVRKLEDKEQPSTTSTSNTPTTSATSNSNTTSTPTPTPTPTATATSISTTSTTPIPTSTTNKETNVHPYGQVVHTYNASETQHPSFGDLSLMYSKPRAATVIAVTNGSLWTLNRAAFRSVLMRKPRWESVKNLRKVDVLKPLTLAQLQRLAEEMTDVSFEKEDIITKDGGDSFFIILEGAVNCCKYNDQGLQEVVSQLEKNQYFGENALLDDQSGTTMMVATSKTTCLTIERSAFERCLGKYSSLIDQDSSRRKRCQNLINGRKEAKTGDFVVLNPPTMDPCPTNINLEDLSVEGVISSLEIEKIQIVKSKDEECYTLRSCSKQSVFNAGIHKQVLGERDMFLSLSKGCLLVPVFHSLCVSPNDIHMLFKPIIVGDLATFLNMEAQSESFVRFYAAEIVISLEYIHQEGIVLRSINPCNILVDNVGHLRLLNMRLAKYVGTGRTYTLCGKPDYLAPEQVNGQGHGCVVDYWALGILLYEMLFQQTPFHQNEPNKDNKEENNYDEMEFFNKISHFKVETLTFPRPIGLATKSLIVGLLSPKPTTRLGYVESMSFKSEIGEVRKHPFFAGVAWDALENGQLATPLEIAAEKSFHVIQSQLHERKHIQQGEDYTADYAWFADF